MSSSSLSHISDRLTRIEKEGLYKRERLIISPRGGEITVGDRRVINLCANNYLGLADHPALIKAAKDAMELKGLGMISSAGHKTSTVNLNNGWHDFLDKGDQSYLPPILTPTAGCLNRSWGQKMPLSRTASTTLRSSMGCDCAKRNAIVTPIMRWGIWPKTAMRPQRRSRHIMIATNGVFSMDGYLANLPEITRLAWKYDAVVMVNDCHSTGFMGPRGAGTADHFGVEVDILTGTLGKTLGGTCRGIYCRTAAGD